MLHRLVMAALFAFLSAGNSRLPCTVAMVAVCVVALVAHVSVQPYRARAVNLLQTCLLASLVMLGVADLGPVALQTLAVPSRRDLDSDHALALVLPSTVRAAQVALLVWPALAALAFGAASCGGCGGRARMRGRRGSRDSQGDARGGGMTMTP